MIINFTRMPNLDNTYQNVLSFEDIETKYNYFNSRIIKSVEINAKPDSVRDYLVVPLSLYESETFDYLFFQHKTRYRYFFITDRQYNTESTTKVFISLDVWTTHWGEWIFNDTFVDRMHVPRWVGNEPTLNTEDENLAYGEIIQVGDKEQIADFSDSVIIASSVPIGLLPTSGGGGGDGTCWESGKCSPKGFRFIKGFEGFAPYEYQDSGGYWTIAYGVTKHGEPDIYANLVSKQPVQEEEGAIISYDLKTTNYGLVILDSFKALGCNNQNQFDALLSLAYNSGNGSITGTNSLTQAIARDPNNESVIRPIWENFKITSGGIPLEGLKQRRKQECNLYFGQDTEIRPILTINKDGSYGPAITENNGDGWLPPECGGGEGDLNGYKSFDNDFGVGWLAPVKGGTVTSKYGWRTHPITGEQTFHHGTDIGAPEGTDYIASKDGVVFIQGSHSSMGNYIYIKHNVNGQDIMCRIMHLSKILTTEGQTVKRGDVVGLVGSTGDSTGPHAHWELRKWNGAIGDSTDPAPILEVGDKV